MISHVLLHYWYLPTQWKPLPVWTITGSPIVGTCLHSENYSQYEKSQALPLLVLAYTIETTPSMNNHRLDFVGTYLQSGNHSQYEQSQALPLLTLAYTVETTPSMNNHRLSHCWHLPTQWKPSPSMNNDRLPNCWHLPKQWKPSPI